MVSGKDKRPSDYSPFTRGEGHLIVAALVVLIVCSQIGWFFV